LLTERGVVTATGSAGRAEVDEILHSADRAAALIGQILGPW
jgi:hypothetical protein